MNYSNKRVAEVALQLKEEFSLIDNKKAILKSNRLRALFAELPSLPPEER
jgi:hypothetical protein